MPDVSGYSARRVVAMTPSEPEAFAVAGDRFAAVGMLAELLERFPYARHVDLGDRVVVPGLHDSHLHLAIPAENLLHLDVSADAVASNEAVLDRLRDEAARVAPGSWLRGSGYNDSRMPGGRLIEWYGAERVGRMFAHRSFLDAGIPVLGSSDYPCGPFEPLLALQSCVTRRGSDGVEVGPEQRIGAREALALNTTAGAAAAGQADLKGRIAPGLLADFVVLADDPLEVDSGRIGAIDVLATYVGGSRVFAAAGSEPEPVGAR